MTLSADDLLAGAVIGDRYRLIERIGVGGMGVVYRAEHTLMKKKLALKVLRPDMGAVEELARRFEREAQSASRLSHPNIVQVLDFGILPSGASFLVMEYLEGESLCAVLQREGRLPVPRASDIARQILEALEHAHEKGVVHRDLKSDNIMLMLAPQARGETVKILDFGLAKLTQNIEPDRPRLTRLGFICGTPEYMSPEQATGCEVDGRTDLYAVGILLYEMLTGRRPFSGENPAAVLHAQLTQVPPTPRTVAPEAAIPQWLDVAVMRALAKKPDDRFGSARSFLDALVSGSADANASGFIRARRRMRRRFDRVRSHLAMDVIRAHALSLWYRACARWYRLSTRTRRRVVIGALALLAVAILLLALAGGRSK